jgi:lysozyme
MADYPFPFTEDESAQTFNAFEAARLDPSYDLIKKEEGYREKAYQNPGDRVTIGYGSTYKPDGSRVKLGDTVTAEQAEEYLKTHVEKEVIPYIDKFVKVPINENQRSALISLIYNIGGPRFANSDVLKKLNKKDYKGAAEAFTQFSKGRGQEGLLRERRLREINQFNKIDKAAILQALRAKYKRIP